MRGEALGGLTCAACAWKAYAVRGRSSTFLAPSVSRGARWFGLRQAQRELNLLGVMWTVLGLDWKLPADRIARRILSGADNGAILCLHDGRGTRSNPDIHETLEAVERILPVLQSRGFTF